MRKNVVVYWVFIFLVGCSSSDAPKISDQSYYPLRVGNFWVYQVNETNILRLVCNGNGGTPSSYQLKELITDSIKNSEGGYTFTIHRYTRPDSTKSWTDLDTWTTRVNSNQVIVNESNIPYVKFIFPLVEKTVWNINSYNSQEATYDTLKNLRQSFTLANGKKMQNTFTARRDNGEFIISHLKEVEVYAASIGLIYKESEELNYFNNTNDPCYGQQVAKNGSIYIQSLISYGHQ
ncbi:MAG TPA: hypothetical protein VGQ59_12800 [Cyclobacteriaceae bacterium]|nr:hypothetical protein [Cyclobacteriaceae bacterium]